jgi:hypothetical protein
MNDNNKMLERVLLMMKYDSSKTLTENSDVVRNEFAQLLNEATPKLQKPAARFTKPPRNPGRIQPSGLSNAQIHAKVNTYAQTPFKNGTYPNAQQQIDYGVLLKTSSKAKPPALAPAPAAPPAKKGKQGTVSANAPEGYTITAKPTKVKSRKPTPKDQSILSRISNNIKNNKGRWAIGLIAGAGLTAAGIYLYLQPKVSPCLLDSLSEEELASLGDAGTTGKISRAQVGNRVADLNGGLSFNMDSNTVTTGNGKYSGSYSCDGNAIKVSIAGANFVIGSTGGADSGTSGGGTSGGGGGGRYKQCPETFPIAMYCKNSTIARVQGCVGATQDGAFGPKTSTALVAKGADGSSITQATIDKVCGPGAAAKIEKLTKDVDTEDLGGGNSTDVNIKSSDNSASEDGIGG